MDSTGAPMAPPASVVALSSVTGEGLSDLENAVAALFPAGDDAHLDGSVYKMEVSGGFYLEEFLEQGGVQSDSELIAFITSHITKGLLDMGISAPGKGRKPSWNWN